MTAPPAAPSGHSLSSYLSRTLLDRLVDGRELYAPEARAETGAVLLSDIQGFTSLVESFAARGRSGLEEITWLLNEYVADVVQAVENNDGDVVSIAGDAFLCYWPATTPDEQTAAATRAAQAALAIQDAIGQRSAGQFPTRIGIGYGDLQLGFVGGLDGRWELSASGAAIGDVTAAERRATAGTVQVSDAAWRHLEQRCQGHANGGGIVLTRVVERIGARPRNSRVSNNGQYDALLRPFLPPAVLDRLVSSNAEWLAESRVVSVVFADIPGLTSTDASELGRAHERVRAFQDIGRRFEGTVRVDVDDKGLLLLAVFGLPPRAHEDDALRAVLAAHELRRALADTGLDRGVGIATGRALCGSFGSDVRRDYMVRGDVINLAARLSHVDSNAPICDAATMRAARGRVAFEPVAAVNVRGRTQPVDVFRPLGRVTPIASRDAQVIGRRRELAVIADRLGVARSGDHAGVTIIQGDAGLGKSRLVSEASRLASDQGLSVLTAGADAIEQTTPYYAWRPVFSSVFGVGPADTAATARERVAKMVDTFPDLERLIPLASAVLPVHIADTPLTAEMTGDIRAENTKRLLSRVLQRFATEHPTLLAIEDVHWLDSSSWGLLLDVAQSVRPLMTLAATRPLGDPVPTDFSRLVQLAGERHLELEGLSADETRALIAARLGVSDVPPSLATFVEERVAGHPFFCEELLQALVAAGAVLVSDGSCTVGDLRTIDVPTTVEGVIISRLDRLAPGEQLCLKVASVIGRLFRERMVRETHPVEDERPEIHTRLEALAAAHLTMLETLEPDLAYLFKHVITRDVTYESMPMAQRQPLHRAVATWYERNHAKDLSPHYALLAYHWARAADPARTVDYLEKAGQQAMFAGAFPDAVTFLTQAMELVDGGQVTVPASRRALWEKGLGLSQYYCGALNASRVHCERALSSLHRPVPVTTGGWTLRTLGEVGRQINHRLFPNRYLGRRVHDKALLDEAVECYRSLGQSYYLEGESPLKLLYVTLSGLNVGEEAGSSTPLARVMINSSMLFYLVGLSKQTEWYAERAIAMAEREGLSALAYVWHIRALTLAQRAAWASAKEANAKGHALSVELGDLGNEADGWQFRTTLAICEGDYEFAPTGWKRQRELAEMQGSQTLMCYSLLDETDTWLGKGDIEQAARALEAALKIETPVTDRGTPIDKARSTAMTRLRQGRDEEAMRAADVVFDGLKRQAMGYQWADDYCEAINVYLALLDGGGDVARAHKQSLEQRVSTGVKRAMSFSRIFRNVHPRAWVLRGQWLRYLGKAGDARAAFLKALAAGEVLDMPFEQARARLELARDARGSEREQLIDATDPVFTKLGALHYRGELRALRAD